MIGQELVMELTGESRVTQVQPPLDVWIRYFEADLEGSVEVELVDGDSGARQNRPIVGHHHNWTIEIPEVGSERPAIIRFRRESTARFRFWIYRPGQPEYGHLTWLLENVQNPFWRRGRRWLIL
jgi:hypothetical protein